MVRFLTERAQHGSLRLSDDDEVHLLDGLRSSASRLLDAPLECVAVVGGASEALSELAAMIASPGGQVVLVSTDFPSVTYPWLLAAERLDLDVVFVADRSGEDLTATIVEAIGPRTIAVCVSAVMYASGSRVDVAAVAVAAREHGARTIVDATQLAGAGPVSMTSWRVDAVVASGYKWLSAHGGVALLAVSADLLPVWPTTIGWMGTDAPFDFASERLRIAGDARRFQKSTISYASAIGLGESIELLLGVGLDRIADHARQLAGPLVDDVAPLGWTAHRCIEDPAASPHLIALSHPRHDARRVQRWLRSVHGIVTSARDGTIRISLHVYNDESDIRTLRDALAHGP
jgi:selenocysteine lyase/cysteine desulfurase